MNIKQRLVMIVLSAVILVPTMANAAIVFPALDIQDKTTDLGATLTSTNFNIDATAFTIVTGADPIDISDESFTLTSTGGSGLFSGTFTVGGSLLTGSFTDLTVLDFGGGNGQFLGDIFYSGGSLQGSLTGGRLEGTFTGSDVIAKLGKVSVVPVPAAVWLFGSGLIGLVGFARRKV